MWGGGGDIDALVAQIKEMQRNSMMADMEALVSEIKEMQRNDMVAKEQWQNYCDLNGDGKRDPAKHDAAFLQDFLMQRSQGVTFTNTSTTLAETTKMMQKRSHTFKQCWSQFCAQYGGGRNDPMKHDPNFHSNFLDHLAAGACAASGFDMAPPSNGGDTPMKQMKEPGTAKRRKSERTFGGDSEKERLVNQVKSFQRLGAEQKELWGTFADAYLQGVRDPAKHESATLQEFCTNFNVPEADMGGSPMLSLDPLVPPPMVAPTDPVKKALVERVKLFQKRSPENREVWVQFCGPYRDPMRQETAKLEEFLSVHEFLR